MKVQGVLLLSALGLVGCSTPSFVTQDKSNVLLLITKIQGIGTGAVTTPSDFLLSDVSFKGSVFNDNAQATLQVVAKDGFSSVTLGTFDGVETESYEVHYTRTDGLNQEGVDVPYSFSASMATLVSTSSTTQTAFIVVRHQAKDEPPLSFMRAGGGSILLSVDAEIIIHGHTVSGQAVQATGHLPITFADFADS